MRFQISRWAALNDGVTSSIRDLGASRLIIEGDLERVDEPLLPVGGDRRGDLLPLPAGQEEVPVEHGHQQVDRGVLAARRPQPEVGLEGVPLLAAHVAPATEWTAFRIASW